MTVAALERADAGPGMGALRGPTVLWLAILAATALSIAAVLSFAPAGDPWSARDNDDMMRMAQVRDWLSGQPYGDLDQARLGPPAGTVEGARPEGGTRMHWSRAADLPIAAIVVAARGGGAADPERVAATLAPLLPILPLLAGLAWGAVGIAGLAGSSRPLVAAGPALVMGVAWVAFANRFGPYALDHHNWQLALLASASGLATLSLARHARGEDARLPAALAGAAAAAMQAIGMEMLPLAIVLSAGLALFWAFGSEPRRHPLGPFALSFALSCLVMLVLFVPGDRWGAVEHDVLTGRHVLAFSGAAGVLGVVAIATAPAAAPLRLAVLAFIAVLGALLLGPVLPALLDGAYSFEDPRIFSLWLDHVSEAAPLQSRLAEGRSFLAFSAVPALGLVLLALATRGAGAGRSSLAVPLSLLLAATLLLFWQIRATAAAHVLAIPAVAAFAATLLRGGVAARLGGYAACLLGLQPVWAIGEAVARGDVAAEHASTTATCRSRDAMAGLAALPPGLVVAPSNLGASIVLHTPHVALAAPYHRNVAGFSALFDTFATDLDTGRDTLGLLGARYVAVCSGAPDLALLAGAAPGGLAAALASGQTPDWLRELPAAGGGLRVFVPR